ncbi:MAG: hypothetical protein AAGJ86_01300 [Pseudomonadota bacterium]
MLSTYLVLLALFSLGESSEEYFDHQSADWHCRNPIEVSCNDNDCAKTDDQERTTMDLLFSEGGALSYGAYEGFWQGKGRVLKTEPFLVIFLEDAPWSWPPHRETNKQNILIALDRKDHIAVVKAGGWAHPFVCKALR